MASVPIKFRCFRCNQLLGVSRAKAGTIVSCPKCAEDLLVPEPDPEEPASAAQAEPAAEGPRRPWASAVPDDPATQEPSGPLDTGVSLEDLDIRPEDIRVEPGFRSAPIPSRPEAARPATVAEPVRVMPHTWSEPVEHDPRPEPPRSATAVTASPAPARYDPEPGVVLPAIEIDAGERSRQKPYIPPARPRDLVLPRSVVAMWSLFVLFALTFAFLAGLLAGHFVWKIH